MQQFRKLILTFVLPLTIILFGAITKWRYVYVEDGPDDFLYGFPLAFTCRGWHTSMSLQIFVLELLFDFLVYFTFCSTIIFLIDKFIKRIVVLSAVKYSLYAFAALTLLVYGFLFSNKDNIFRMNRYFKYEEIKNGYKLV